MEVLGGKSGGCGVGGKVGRKMREDKVLFQMKKSYDFTD